MALRLHAANLAAAGGTLQRCRALRLSPPSACPAQGLPSVAAGFCGSGRWASSSTVASTTEQVGRGRDPERVKALFNTPVSESGSADALFQEALRAIRKQRAAAGAVRDLYEDTPEILKLRSDERELTRKIFRRVDPTQDVTSDSYHGEHHIDPYWNPFRKVEDLKGAITAEFDEYARYTNAAEQRRTRIQVKKALRRHTAQYNPYTYEAKKYFKYTIGQEAPKPFHLPDKYWERSPLQAKLGQEKITWRDVDIIQHFLADNGYILPRRTTTLTRQKQKELVLAVRGAQRMALIPYDWKPADHMAMPLMDPLQFMADRLTDRVIEYRDRRSQAMLQVMIERHPEIDYRRFLKHEARPQATPKPRSS